MKCHVAFHLDLHCLPKYPIYLGYPSLVLVQLRKTGPYITERLLMGHKESKQFILALLCVMFYCVFVTFPCGILGQVGCLIVSIPDLCLLSNLSNH